MYTNYLCVYMTYLSGLSWESIHMTRLQVPKEGSAIDVRDQQHLRGLQLRYYQLVQSLA